MKVIGLDFNDNRLSNGKSVAIKACNIDEVEEIVAPEITSNHSETLVSDSE